MINFFGGDGLASVDLVRVGAEGGACQLDFAETLPAVVIATLGGAAAALVVGALVLELVPGAVALRVADQLGAAAMGAGPGRPTRH